MSSEGLVRVDEELYLLPPKNGDIRNLMNLLQDEEIHANTLEIPYPYTVDDAEKFIRMTHGLQREYGRPMIWGIHSRDKGLLGMIGFKPIGNDKERIEIGYWLGKSHWNRGIMTKVVSRVTEKGLSDYGYRRIEMAVFKSNAASCRVAEKCGYHFEREIKDAYEKAGRKIDARLYSRVIR